jgi:hypothetical protein
LKEVPAELSATSLPQRWHTPRGRKIKPQPVVAMTLADPIKPSSDRRRRPVYIKLPEQNIPFISTDEIKKLKTDKCIPLAYLLQENAPHVTTTLGNVQRASPLYYHVSICKNNK